MIIGCGTGRCGTKSLAALLGITHERSPVLPWNINKKLYERRVQNIGKGDVASSYLNYLPDFIKDHNAKVICLMRKREEVVNSFMHKTGRKNHWQNHDGLRWDKDSFDSAFPKFEVDNKEEAIGLYWDLYKDRIYRLVNSHPYNIAIFDIEALNSRNGQESIFDFAGISENEREYNVGIKLNKNHG